MSKIKKLNSWVLSVENCSLTKYYHHFFCHCSHEFKLQTEINEIYAPDILCPRCANDYFKDAIAFESMNSTKIWKYFRWERVLKEDAKSWDISLRYEVPIYNAVADKVFLQEKELLHVRLQKDASEPCETYSKSKFISKYSLYLDDKPQKFYNLMTYEAKDSLCDFILRNKSKTIEWIDDKQIEKLTFDDRLKYITYFLKHSHLKEHRFFFWRLENISEHTIEHTTEVEMLEFISNNHKGKSIKKALYRGYEISMNSMGYYPYSDYVFSRTILNTDLLTKLYDIHPTIKQHLFSSGNFEMAIEFIEFLKLYYTEIQIVRFFVEYMQDRDEYNTRLSDFNDTLQMLHTRDIATSLDEHFTKVKLTPKKLHDEIVRVSHLMMYELDSKEIFEYDERYLSACSTHSKLEFRLPPTVKEFSLWSRILHNCMFGYSRRIHRQESIIYGVFKDDELLYAVEINDTKIGEAKAGSNRMVPDEDMRIIREWRKGSFL